MASKDISWKLTLIVKRFLSLVAYSLHQHLESQNVIQGHSTLPRIESVGQPRSHFRTGLVILKLAFIREEAQMQLENWIRWQFSRLYLSGFEKTGKRQNNASIKTLFVDIVSNREFCSQKREIVIRQQEEQMRPVVVLHLGPLWIALPSCLQCKKLLIDPSIVVVKLWSTTIVFWGYQHFCYSWTQVNGLFEQPAATVGALCEREECYIYDLGWTQKQNMLAYTWDCTAFFKALVCTSIVYKWCKFSQCCFRVMTFFLEPSWYSSEAYVACWTSTSSEHTKCRWRSWNCLREIQRNGSTNKNLQKECDGVWKKDSVRSWKTLAS